jgi:hypothetical protein
LAYFINGLHRLPTDFNLLRCCCEQSRETRSKRYSLRCGHNSNAVLYSTVDLQIGNVTIILLCDSIVRECEKILTASYRLADILQTRAAQDDQELLWKFTMMVKDNVPGFSAAGFFSLDKSIILKILNSLIIMLIVMIQLKST